MEFVLGLERTVRYSATSRKNHEAGSDPLLIKRLEFAPGKRLTDEIRRALMAQVAKDFL